jgi:hypothetical protein
MKGDYRMKFKLLVIFFLSLAADFQVGLKNILDG